MKHRNGLDKQAHCENRKKAGLLLGVRDKSRDGESCQDIVRIARSLGFSHEELLEIRRLYQPAMRGDVN